MGSLPSCKPVPTGLEMALTNGVSLGGHRHTGVRTRAFSGALESHALFPITGPFFTFRNEIGTIKSGLN